MDRRQLYAASLDAARRERLACLEAAKTNRAARPVLLPLAAGWRRSTLHWAKALAGLAPQPAPSAAGRQRLAALVAQAA